MTENHRTPDWWRALPAWAQVLWLATWLPGVVFHELTHALVARPWGSATFDWDEIAVVLEWRGEHYPARAAAHIAPFVVGSAVTCGLVWAASGRLTGLVEFAIAAYVLLNLGVYTVASLADVAVCAHYCAEWYRSRTDTDAVEPTNT